MNDSSYILLAPGPVNLHPEVRKILSLPMIHHRTPEFDKILARVLKNIKKVFCTEQDVFLMTSTGSGGMEALLVNTLSPGDKVIAIISGKFGERWAQMAQTFGANVIAVNIEWGQAVDPLEIEKLLKQNPDTRAVLCQACETSTATAHPIKELGEIIKNYSETLFLVDAITALGAYPLPMDDWHIDGLVGGSQKAFMLPTGMSFLSLSKKAWAFVEKAKCPRFYFDLRKEKKSNASGETFYSSNVSIIRALDWVLEDIDKKTLTKHFDEIHQRANFLRTFAPQIGYSIYSKNPSDSVTALTVPNHLDGQKIRSALEEKYHITIMGGQDQAKGKIIRIGHMGYIQKHEELRLLESLGLVLQELDSKIISKQSLDNVLMDAKKYLQI